MVVTTSRYSEDFPSFDKLGIRETAEGLQLIDEDGNNLIDTIPIPRSHLHK